MPDDPTPPRRPDEQRQSTTNEQQFGEPAPASGDQQNTADKRPPRDPNKGRYPANAEQQNARSPDAVSPETQAVMDEMVEEGTATRVTEDPDGEIRTADANDQPGKVQDVTDDERRKAAMGDDVFNDSAPERESEARSPAERAALDANSGDTAARSGRAEKADELLDEVERRRADSSETDKEQAFQSTKEEDPPDPVSSEELGIAGDGSPDFSKLQEDRSHAEEMNGLKVTFHEPSSENELMSSIRRYTENEEDIMGMRKGAALAIAKVEGYEIPEAEWDEFSTSNKMRIGNKALNLSGVLDFTIGRRGGRTPMRGSR